MKYLKNTSDQDFFNLDIDQSAQSFLDTKSHQWQLQLNTEQFARYMDNVDPLAHMRKEFFYPKKGTLPNGLYK